MNGADREPDGARKTLEGLLARPPLRRLLDLLNRDGEEARVVGGAVRNALFGRPITDIDLATTATPQVVSTRAEQAGLKAVPTGLEHGTVTVIAHETVFEVTTLREDVETDGRRATVRFGRDFDADARRRDFTINALSLGADGVLHDPVGGLRDLAARRVVFIGDPGARIREDYLRILRFFRFQAEYAEGPLDPSGLAAAIHEREGLAVLSHERIRAEFLKLIRARRAVEVVAAVCDAGLMQRLFGGVVEIGRFARVARVERQEGVEPDALRRLAALGVATVEDADRLREALRLSNAEHARLLGFARVLARLRSIGRPLDAADLRRLAVEHGAEAVGDGLAALRGEPRPVIPAEVETLLQRFVAGEESIPVFPLRGADLIGRGVGAGPDIGALLAQARAAWLAAGCPSGESAREDLMATLFGPP